MMDDLQLPDDFEVPFHLLLFCLDIESEIALDINKWRSMKSEMEKIKEEELTDWPNTCKGAIWILEQLRKSIIASPPQTIKMGKRSYTEGFMYQLAFGAMVKGIDIKIEYLKNEIAIHGKKTKPSGLKKLHWLGTQKQLAELLIQLKRKGWIEEFENATIKACFSKTDTIQEYLKPQKDSTEGNPTYGRLFDNNYPEIFTRIPSRKDVTD